MPGCGLCEDGTYAHEEILNIVNNIGLIVQSANIAKVDDEVKRLEMCVECWKATREREGGK